MSKIIRVKPKSFYEATIYEYTDRIVAHVVCNNCGEKFSLTLRANPIAIKVMNQTQIKNRVFGAAHKRHDCDTDALVKDPAETNRIINKWHEYKRKLLSNGEQK